MDDGDGRTLAERDLAHWLDAPQGQDYPTRESDDWTSSHWEAYFAAGEPDYDAMLDPEEATAAGDECEDDDLDDGVLAGSRTIRSGVSQNISQDGKQAARSETRQSEAVNREAREDRMEDSSPRLVYNPDDGSVMLHTSGPAVTVDGVVGDVVFERMTQDGESALALWLESAQADVLVKMIRHILEKVPIRPESQQLLRDILPQIEALLEQHNAG